MKDTENNKDTKKFSLKKLDYTENMIELTTVVIVLGAQIAKIDKNPNSEVHKNLFSTIQNIRNGLTQEATNYDQDKAKKIIEKRGAKVIKFDKKQDKTGIIRQFANSALYELTDFENLLGKNMKDSKGVENNSNIFINLASKLTFGAVSKDTKVSTEIQNHIENIAKISQDFAEAANSKERAFYLQQMNDELNQLVKSKDNDMKWDKSFKAYLTEFVESFQKFLTVTAPSLFKKQITEEKKYNIVFEAQQQLEVQQNKIFDSLTTQEKAAIQLTHSKRTPNNIGNIKDLEQDILQYKKGVIKEEKDEAKKGFLQKTLGKVQTIGNSSNTTPARTFLDKNLKSAKEKMDQYFELMRQKKQLENYVSTDPTQQTLNAAHPNNTKYQKEQAMLLHLLEEAQRPLKDRTELPMKQDTSEPAPSEEARKLIANFCKKIPPVKDEQVTANTTIKLQQHTILEKKQTHSTKPVVGAQTAALNNRRKSSGNNIPRG